MVKEKPRIRYFPQGLGAELFEELKSDPRLEVMRVTMDDPTLDYDNNVCAHVTYKGRQFSIGRPTRNGTLHDLSRALRMGFDKYRVAEANV